VQRFAAAAVRKAKWRLRLAFAVAAPPSKRLRRCCSAGRSFTLRSRPYAAGAGAGDQSCRAQRGPERAGAGA